MEDFLVAVVHFGTAVLQASHNRVMELFGELTSAMLTDVLDAYVTKAGIRLETANHPTRWAAQQFAVLVDLIEERDGDRAEQFWRDQLARAGAAPWPSPSPFEIYSRPTPHDDNPSGRRASCR